jgi:CRISPR-associated protein Cas2
MKQRLAEYKTALSIGNLKDELELIQSTLFDQVLKKPNKVIEPWFPDFDHIFKLLQLNFNNPRAMNCFIFYDIVDNKLRTYVAKYLLEMGCQRIQKSVYLANISKQIYTSIFTTFVELEEVFGARDSVFMVPIGEYHLAEMKMIGKDVDMSFARSSAYVIFI